MGKKEGRGRSMGGRCSWKGGRGGKGMKKGNEKREREKGEKKIKERTGEIILPFTMENLASNTLKGTNTRFLVVFPIPSVSISTKFINTFTVYFTEFPPTFVLSTFFLREFIFSKSNLILS